jgi:hypothetical protein
VPGSFSVDKDLRIFGNTNRQAPTVLDGAGGGGVLFVNERVTVTLTRLTITGGNTGVRVGGGIHEHPDPQPDDGQRQRPRRLRLLAAVTGL